MNEKELYVVKQYKFDNPLITKIDSIIDGFYRDCHNEYFHTFKYVCIYDLTLTNITNNEIINTTISDESLGLYEFNKKLTIARERSLKFNQTNKLTIKIYSDLSSMNIHYYLKHQIPMGQRLFFRRIAQNRDYIQTHCIDINKPFHFACRQWYSYHNQGILT